MGHPLPVKAKRDGKVGESWFKASAFAEMVLGSRRFPGGASAWVPSLALLIGRLKLEQRDKVAAVEGARISLYPASSALRLHASSRSAPACTSARQRTALRAGSAQAPAAASQPADGRTSLQTLMENKYGPSLARTLLLILKGYDAYKKWRLTLDAHSSSADEHKRAALAMAVAGASWTQPVLACVWCLVLYGCSRDFVRSQLSS